MALSSWFRGIKGKLFIAALLPLAGFAIVGFISLNGANKLNTLLEKTNRDVVPNIQSFGTLKSLRLNFAYSMSSALSLYDRKQDFAEDLKAAKDSIPALKSALAEYEKTTSTPEEEKLYSVAKGKYAELIATMEKIVTLFESKDPQNIEKSQDLLIHDFKQLSVATIEFTENVTKIYNDMATATSLEAKDTQKSVNQWILLITLFSTCLVMGTLLMIASRISSTVASIADRLTTSGDQVKTSVEQLNLAGVSLSQSSTEAAASLEETVASLEELSSMVKLNSDNAKQAASLSASSRESAEKGQQEITTLIDAMANIAKSSKKIEEIISVIDDIAFQTNLLALNAAVEAARAGEQGKGFAVVAEAVRALAQRSAVAAKDITNLIKESVEQVEGGGRIASQSGEVLNNIVLSVKKVADLNNEIASASTEQTSGLQQISKAMNHLDQSSQSNAASAEEIAATSEEINNLAFTSQKLTSELSEVINGKTDHAHVSATPQPTPAKKEKTNVIPLKAKAVKAPAKSAAKQTIPFDDDEAESRSKVGTTDGF